MWKRESGRLELNKLHFGLRGKKNDGTNHRDLSVRYTLGAPLMEAKKISYASQLDEMV